MIAKDLLRGPFSNDSQRLSSFGDFGGITAKAETGKKTKHVKRRNCENSSLRPTLTSAYMGISIRRWVNIERESDSMGRDIAVFRPSETWNAL